MADVLGLQEDVPETPDEEKLSRFSGFICSPRSIISYRFC